MRRLWASMTPLLSALLRRSPYPGRAAAGPGRGRCSYGTEITLPESECDQASFRAAMRAFASSVSVVTALDEQGVPRGLTCSAVCSLSMDPPSMLACVNRRNGTLGAIRHSGGFVVNLLKAGRSDLSDTFASSSPAKFTAAEWYPSPESGLPILTSDALAIIECKLEAEIVVSSHVVIIGTVRRSETFSGTDSPLVYLSKCYGSWASLEVAQSI